MFETNMTANMQQISILRAIQGDTSNIWRKLVSREWKSFLDSISTTIETTEENCDE